MTDKRGYSLDPITTVSASEMDEYFANLDKLELTEAVSMSLENLAKLMFPKWSNMTITGETLTNSWYTKARTDSLQHFTCRFSKSMSNAEYTFTTNITSTQLISGYQYSARAYLKMGVSTAYVDVKIYNDGGTIKLIFTPTLGSGTYEVYIWGFVA